MLRTINLEPKNVNKSNDNFILKRIIANGKLKVTLRTRFNEGDKVIINGYNRRSQKVVYQIGLLKCIQCGEYNRRFHPVTYILNDETGNIIKGCFYQEELNETNLGNVYLRERVLRKI